MLRVAEENKQQAEVSFSKLVRSHPEDVRELVKQGALSLASRFVQVSTRTTGSVGTKRSAEGDSETTTEVGRWHVEATEAGVVRALTI